MDKQQQQPKKIMRRKHRRVSWRKRWDAGLWETYIKPNGWLGSNLETNDLWGNLGPTHRNGWQDGNGSSCRRSGSVIIVFRRMNLMSQSEFLKPCHCQLPLLVPKPMRYDEHQPITMLITHSLERDPALHVAAWNWMRSTVIQHWQQPKTTLFLKRNIFQTAPFLQTCSHLVATLCFSMVY